MKHRLAPTFFVLGLSTVFLGAGCRQILDIEEPVACGSDDACTTADSPCIAGECVDGFCAYSFKAAGTVIDEAAEDDCKSNVCDGNGELVVAIVPDDAPPDATPGDCQAPACDAEGNVISGPAEDAPPDDVSGDCSAPACDGQGGVTVAPSDGDVPMMGDAPGDCVRPACSGGAVVDEPNDEDAPADDVPGNCLSPACDAGQVVQVPSEKDAPGEDIDGDCLAPACDMGGMQAIDDEDVPTSGCGSCSGGVVVPWAEVGTACYTGDAGTQGVGICVGGTWACDDSNVKVCAGEQVPISETCQAGGSGLDDDCDMDVDEEGPGCLCQLGQTQACYTGPGGTQNVGICDDGVSTCQATGMGNQFGACVGEVLPQACDSCLVPGDQDCSGTSAACDGSHLWSKSIGGTEFEYGYDIQPLPNGNILVAGSFGTSITAGNTVTTDGGWDGALIRLDADGNAINVKDFGGSGEDTVYGITLLDDGYAIFGKLGNGSAETFGSGATLTAVGNDGYIAKFNSSHTLQWKKLIGGTTNESIAAMVRMPDNGVAIAGHFDGTLNVGGNNLVSSGSNDIFVARFDAAGAHVWSKKFGNNQANNVYDMEVASNGDLVMVGDLTANITFGATTITLQGGTDGYVVRMNDDGNVLWAKGIGSSGNERVNAVGVLSDGSAWVVGDFNTALNLNGVAGTEISPTASGEDILMVKYAADGTYLASKGINSTGVVSVLDVGVGPDDGIVVTGTYDGALFFGMIATLSEQTDAFMFKSSPTNGNVLWSRKVSGLSSQSFRAAEMLPCGDVVAVGEFWEEEANYGGGVLPNNGYGDFAIAKYRQ
jgi:hypothetical protein